MTTHNVNDPQSFVNSSVPLPRGMQAVIAGLLGVSRQSVSAAIQHPEKFTRIARIVTRYQKTGKLPKRRPQVKA